MKQYVRTFDNLLKNTQKFVLYNLCSVLYLLSINIVFYNIYIGKREKIWLIGLILLTTFIYYIINYRYIFAPLKIMEQKIQMSESTESELNRKYTEKIARKQAELDALQSQINPHFLYNTLESIRGEAIELGANEIADMTEALAIFFRYSISQKGNLVTLREELNNVECYFSIQRFRFSERFDLSIEYPLSSDDIMYTLMPKLTLQPIIENCIFHGLEPKIDKGKISMKVLKSGSRLIIKISDNGVGMTVELLENLNKKLTGKVTVDEEEKKIRGSGIALINVNQRIKILFGQEYGIRVMSHEKIGTDIELTLPFITNQKEIEAMHERDAIHDRV